MSENVAHSINMFFDFFSLNKSSLFKYELRGFVFYTATLCFSFISQKKFLHHEIIECSRCCFPL